MARMPDISNASISELIEIRNKAEEIIEEKKDQEVQRLKSKWENEASELDMTPMEVLGIIKKGAREHKTSVFYDVNDESNEYSKGPHPKWLNLLLKKHKMKSVKELVEAGIVAVR